MGSFHKGSEQQCKLGRNWRGILCHHTVPSEAESGIPTNAVLHLMLANPVNYKPSDTVNRPPELMVA